MSPREVSVAEHERWREALANPERWLEPDDHLALLDAPPALVPVKETLSTLDAEEDAE